MIPICKDPALTMLKSKGYNVVRLPKADLLPTQLLVRNGRTLKRLGDLSSAFVADQHVAPPPISGDNPAPPMKERFRWSSGSRPCGSCSTTENIV